MDLPERTPAELTPPQREIATLIAAGFTTGEIASRLNVTPGTVNNHVEHIIRRLKLRDRAHIAAWAATNGLYHLDEDQSSPG